jgi:cytochrome c5
VKQFYFILFYVCFAVANHAVADTSKEENNKIYERIKPVAEICMKGEKCATAAAPPKNKAMSGEEVYNTACTACHSIGLLGAPKTGDVIAWAARLEKGLDKTLLNAINGLNGIMPPKGNCINCSDDELTKAIEFMSK